MGWLDKLLGREEKVPEAPAAPEAPPEPAPPQSSVSEAEDRVAAERDESLESENRIPPGTG